MSVVFSVSYQKFPQMLEIEDGGYSTGQLILTKVHPDDREKLVAEVASTSTEQPHLQDSFRVQRS